MLRACARGNHGRCQGELEWMEAAGCGGGFAKGAPAHERKMLEQNVRPPVLV